MPGNFTAPLLVLTPLAFIVLLEPAACQTSFNLVPDSDGFYSRMICGVPEGQPLPAKTDCMVTLPNQDDKPSQFVGASVDANGAAWLNLPVLEWMISHRNLEGVPITHLKTQAEGQVSSVYSTFDPNAAKAQGMTIEDMTPSEALLACKIASYYTVFTFYAKSSDHPSSTLRL